jgi:hypothetical protein
MLDKPRIYVLPADEDLEVPQLRALCQKPLPQAFDDDLAVEVACSGADTACTAGSCRVASPSLLPISSMARGSLVLLCTEVAKATNAATFSALSNRSI